MKLVSTLFSLALLGSAAAFLSAGCGGDAKPGDPGGAAGSGAGGGATTTSAGGTGGGTTSMPDPLCDALCTHLEEINCSLLQNCAVDCPNHLGAPPDCTDEADALIACWVEHLSDFECTQQGALPPAACNDAETTFNKCVGGDTPVQSCLCSSGVGVGGPDVSNCSRKTTCGMLEFNQTCQQVEAGQPWTCTCLLSGALLGTCSEPPEYEHCSNDYGCCVPLFCAASAE